RNGDWATITTARAEIEARVLVSERIPDLRLKRRTVHQIGLPYHWGSKGLVRGDAANELISFVADPNVLIQESKALTGNIAPGRRSARRRIVTSRRWFPPAPGPTSGKDDGRDLPAVGERPRGTHGVEEREEKEGEQT
ncbi:MAG: hypothetical protein ABR600_02230, partial [Actinomycetota bacterium]